VRAKPQDDAVVRLGEQRLPQLNVIGSDHRCLKHVSRNVWGIALSIALSIAEWVAAADVEGNMIRETADMPSNLLTL
jgi:hypothetical protein